jgi:hypothetical protein
MEKTKQYAMLDFSGDQAHQQQPEQGERQALPRV